MLSLHLQACRVFDERTQEFLQYPAATLRLEHSLISIQRWESKWHKSYLSSKGFTMEEFLDYIRCMSLDPNVGEDIGLRLTREQFMEIRAYMENSMTATTFSNLKKEKNAPIITAEIVYYWMTAFNIPFECAKWHINQLLTLIQVCSIKNNPKKGGGDANRASWIEENKARRAMYGSKG